MVRRSRAGRPGYSRTPIDSTGREPSARRVLQAALNSLAARASVPTVQLVAEGRVAAALAG